MNIELASKVFNHITLYPQNHTELVWGDLNELGTVGSVAAYCALFSGIAKVKNRGITLIEEDNVAPDWIKTTQELLGIPFSCAFRMCILSTEEQAVKALEYITRGKLPDWKAIYGITGYPRDKMVP